ncbi:phosphocholine-specific phospholipase C [Mucilaginibacter myungsuensis]|uniref:phospholipase C n=1 Tax=Mucilaginibacter myungsuensis TaxID=649104 RepID=A0A929L476_9SPHI|nr:phospholipase C, phosphocholine-specific [Mucilaginibacter myungsuensis]MBE9663720.1 phospholipase C, phosphocholine-specific [Mucilaginibacter myungsuensis]MDN3598956.1 phospholipase C, phosphocholine-specific [Mucilaginibacter myungsuensis]
MTDTRREFIKKATLLTGAAGLFSIMPESIQKALAIEPEKGSTYLDAEHIVFLMQENRSFDHCYGTLQGVRGFDDPRAMQLPNKNKVWLQTNKAGKTYVPFNLDIKNSKATWMQSLPHSWDNQVDARNKGKMDGWLEAKKSGNKDYKHMPLTMGYYDRRDIPFYYALADAFTVCDQNFCSALTGTSPNRIMYWSGTVRSEQNENSPAKIYNGEIDHHDIKGKTFPERLEDAGISWKTYQNELSIGVGFEGDEDDWLANFTDNDLEFYKQYNVRLHKAHRDYLPKRLKQVEASIAELEKQEQTPKVAKDLANRKAELEGVKKAIAEFTQEKFDSLSDFEKNIHNKAFVTNTGDPDYHKLEKLVYDDNGTKREVEIPKGDVLHQFRKDVNENKLPTVSWLVAPSNFSDHPGSPWYGAWYISEVMDILTKNPEVWKKTIFILNYDENDGYFDHIAPFVPPQTSNPETGKCSAGIDTSVEHVTKAQIDHLPEKERGRRESAIGLGFRVPMVIASPWSRGGWVNSEIFDHTSCLQFLETFLSKKSGKDIKETNISDWRRTVTGDLTSAFRPYNGEKINYPTPLKRNETIQSIYNAKFKELPHNYKELTEQDVKTINAKPTDYDPFPRQEKGQRQSCALPYDLTVNGKLNADSFEIRMKSGKGNGAPFNVSTHNPYQDGANTPEAMRVWDFAVKANDEISYAWPVNNFANGVYDLKLNGPNGFFRQFAGGKADPKVAVTLVHVKNGDVEIELFNADKTDQQITITDHAYNQTAQKVAVKAGQKVKKTISLKASHQWYDLGISINGHADFVRRYAGRAENGQHGFTDPVIGA